MVNNHYSGRILRNVILRLGGCPIRRSVKDAQDLNRVLAGPVDHEVASRGSFHSTGPSMPMALFHSRRVTGHEATISAVTGWDRAR